jgi:hypothetical protein
MKNLFWVLAPLVIAMIVAWTPHFVLGVALSVALAVVAGISLHNDVEREEE